MTFDPTSLVLASSVARAGDHTGFYRAHRAGGFVRLAHGVHLPSTLWNALSTEDRHLARLHALDAAAQRPPLFSHLSAAALHRLPLVADPPELAHILVAPVGGGRRRRWAAVHTDGPIDDEVLVDGLHATSLVRTLVDVARTTPLSIALPMLDHAVARRGTSPEDLIGLAALRNAGSAKAALAICLTDPLSASAGESVSRAAMHVAGVPRPVLQQDFRDRQGLMTVDFWWPACNLVGEFDGEGKYLRDEYRRGRTPAQVVIDEKNRENRLRALGLRVARWDWATAWNPAALALVLRDAGLSW